MKIISEYKILIDRDRNVDFVLDSNDEFKSYGVSLFNISISKLYGNSNFIERNIEYLNYLKNSISSQNSRISIDNRVKFDYDFIWQHEIFVEFLSDSVYIEKWGLCTKIKKKELLEIFEDGQLFLNRWNSKEVFKNQIKNLLSLKGNEEAKRLFYIKGESKNSNDQIQIMLSEDDFEMDINDYIESVRLPVHMV